MMHPVKGDPMSSIAGRLFRETDGQDLIEYALLAAIIAVGVTAAMQGVRTALQTKFNAVSTGIGS